MHVWALQNKILIDYAYSTGHFVLHDFLSTFMIISFKLVDTLFTQCALKCKNVQHDMS